MTSQREVAPPVLTETTALLLTRAIARELRRLELVEIRKRQRKDLFGLGLILTDQDALKAFDKTLRLHLRRLGPMPSAHVGLLAFAITYAAFGFRKAPKYHAAAFHEEESRRYSAAFAMARRRYPTVV